ncbi:MAG: hypothetical protein RIS88_1317 [Pseudomonadota bacterium]|jgi:sugar phosphate isomerase/epimerase
MKLALCNEVLRHLSLDAQCEMAAQLGYQGLEVAPFTLFQDARELDERLAARARASAQAQGLLISSLHWLLVKPEGLSMVTPDEGVRQATLDWIRRLIAFAQHCGARVLVHGSPAQRNPQAGQSLADAHARLEDSLRRLAPWAQAAGVTYCLEPLSRVETSVVNTVQEAAQMIARVGSPAVRTMLDASAASQAESEPIAQVLARHLDTGDIAHVQVNDKNRRGPGQGDTDLLPLVRVLRERQYTGWVAVEPFEYRPDGATTAAFSAGHMQALWRATA